MRIQHNIAAMNSLRQLTGNNNAVSKSLEKLSSGYRINRAGDDAAGLAISEKMRAQIRGLSMASKNAQDGISLVQTAEGALTETHSILQRMRELAVQASNGIYADEDREQTQLEIDALKTEVDRISTATTFNGINLLDGSKSTKGAIEQVNAETRVAVDEWLAEANSAFKDFATKVEITASETKDAQEAVAAGAGTGAMVKIDFGSNNPAAGDSIVINGTTYEFVVAAGDTTINTGATKVVIGAASKNTLQNLVDKIDDTLTAGTTGSTYVYTKNGTDAFTAGTDTAVVIQANDPSDNSKLASVKYEVKENAPAVANPAIITFTAGTPAGAAIPANNSQITYEFDLDAAKIKSGSTITMQAYKSGTTDTLEERTYHIFNTDAERVAAGKGTAESIIVDTSSATVAADTNEALANALAAKLTADGTKAAAADGKLTIEARDMVASNDTAAEFNGLMGKLTFNNDPAGALKTEADALAALDKQFYNADVEADYAKFEAEERGVVFQIGANGKDDQRVEIEIGDMGAEALGIKDVNLTTQEGAIAAIDVIDKAINSVSAQRAELGALQNRLEHTINNLDTNNENLTASESRIRDVDMAAEMMKYTQNNVLVQAAQSMLAQANQQPQSVLSLLQ